MEEKCKHHNFVEVIDKRYPSTLYEPAEYVWHVHCKDCGEDFDPDDFDFEAAEEEEEEE